MFQPKVYSTELGEWTTIDPLVAWNPKSLTSTFGNWNPYKYCGGDSVNCVDVSGNSGSQIWNFIPKAQVDATINTVATALGGAWAVSMAPVVVMSAVTTAATIGTISTSTAALRIGMQMQFEVSTIGTFTYKYAQQISNGFEFMTNAIPGASATPPTDLFGIGGMALDYYSSKINSDDFTISPNDFSFGDYNLNDTSME